MDGIVGNPLRLKFVNHISLLCKSVKETVAFYEKVLGFISIVRPGSFNFDGAWLFGHGIGIHLLLAEDPYSSVNFTDREAFELSKRFVVALQLC